jgi:hypothetical protein
MIKKQCFEALKVELSRAVFAFEKQAQGINLHFNGHTNFQEFKQHLTNLHLELATEIHDNVSNFSTRKEVELYFEMLLYAFELLNNLIGPYSDFECVARNVKMHSKENPEISCIHFDPAEMNQMKDYFHFQKSIIENSIHLASSFKQKFETSIVDSDAGKISSMQEMVEFAPYLSKLREELGEMCSERKKIKFLKNQRKRLTVVFVEKGIDLYNTSINIWFEARIEACRETIFASQKKQKNKKSALTWLLSATDFLELMMSFDKIKAIGDGSSNPISRKELILQFSKFLNVKEIPDSESRITKLIDRNNPTSFLDRLREKINILVNEK